MSFNIKCKHLTEKPFDIEVEGTTTVLEIKEKVGVQVNVPAESQKLIFKGKFREFIEGRILKNEDLASDLGMSEGDTIHMVK